MSKYPNPNHPEDPVKFSVVLRRWVLDFPWNRVSPETEKLLQNGRLAMKCRYCGTESIAGPWCWKCTRMSDPDDWYKAASVSPEGKRRRGRPSKAELDAAIKYCEVCVYA